MCTTTAVYIQYIDSTVIVFGLFWVTALSVVDSCLLFKVTLFKEANVNFILVTETSNLLCFFLLPRSQLRRICLSSSSEDLLQLLYDVFCIFYVNFVASDAFITSSGHQNERRLSSQLFLNPLFAYKNCIIGTFCQDVKCPQIQTVIHSLKPFRPL